MVLIYIYIYIYIYMRIYFRKAWVGSPKFLNPYVFF
jgi:hypothetical protein